MSTTETTKSDLSLSEVWDAMVAAGAQVYEWCEDGVATGCQAILMGDRLAISVSDSEGYQIDAAPDDEDLVPTDEYDTDEAERGASDLEGFFGVVGLPGSQYHRFEWFADETEAADWADETRVKILTENPVIGDINGGAVTASKAFDVTYLDGNKVYFRPKQIGRGYDPKTTMEE